MVAIVVTTMYKFRVKLKRFRQELREDDYCAVYFIQHEMGSRYIHKSLRMKCKVLTKYDSSALVECQDKDKYQHLVNLDKVYFP